MPLDLPFSAMDEGIYHLELHSNPWNIQVEIGTKESLDLDRLDRAVTEACARHPMARAALQPWEGRDTKYRWVVEDEPITGVVEEAAPDRDVDNVRAELYDRQFDLHSAPNFSAVVVRRPDGDLFLLSVSHIIADGVGAMRLLHSITRHYRDAEDPGPPVELEEARDLAGTLTPSGPKERLQRAGDNLGMLGDAIAGPARIAVTATSGAEGYGFVPRVLSTEATSTIFATKPKGTTLNDVLIAGLQLTIQRWNEIHGQKAGRIVIMMPFNVRPQDRFHDVVSNIVTFVNVSTDPQDRTSFESAILAVSKQSEELKKARGAGLHTLANLGRHIPVAFKRRLTDLLPKTNYRVIATAVLSNLGRLPETPRFDEDSDEPTELWFSPPCAMPLGVGLGVATIGGRLHLSVRYRREQFERTDAESFADMFVQQITALEVR